MMRLLGICLVGLLHLCGVGSPAFAGYCEDQYGAIRGLRERPVRGSCRSLRIFTIDGPTGPSRLELWADGDLRATPASLTTIVDAVGDVARRVGPKLREVRGPLGLPPIINVVIIAGTHPTRRDAIAETFPLSTMSAAEPVLQCPQLIYSSGLIPGQALRRTLAHELFHCAQESVLQAQMRAAGSDWWVEGSAEWFEDFVFPEHYRFANTNVAVQAFHDRSPTVSLLRMSYETVVFFAWLQQSRGPGAIGPYLAQMAGTGMAQLAGARRALDPAAYDEFAQAYIDETITLPSGVTVTGPALPHLADTTGEPEADPDITRRQPEPLTLMRGWFDVVPGGYRPKGTFGDKERVFSERPGTWSKLPEDMEVRCGERRKFRFASISVADAPVEMKVKPGTYKAVNCGECGATGPTVRRAGCVVGSWQLAAGSGGNCDWLGSFGGSMPGVSVSTVECNPGTARVSFNRDGSFEGTVNGVRRQVQITFQSRRGVSSPPVTAFNVISLAKSAGLWKAEEEGGALKLCSTTTTGAGFSEMIGGPRPAREPMRFGTLESLDFSYTCRGNAMSITYSPPGLPAFSYQLERIGPPAGDTPPPAR